MVFKIFKKFFINFLIFSFLIKILGKNLKNFFKKGKKRDPPKIYFIIRLWWFINYFFFFTRINFRIGMILCF